MTQAVLAAPLATNTAMPVSTGELIARQTLVLDRRGTGDLLREEWRSMSALVYGVNARTAAIAVLPYRFISLKGPGVDRNEAGLGDARAFVRHTVYQKDGAGQTARVAPIIGVQIPTGDDDRMAAGMKLPPMLQPGDGRWHGTAGIIATWANTKRTFDLELLHSRSEGGQLARTNFGLSTQFRIPSARFASAAQGYLMAVAELRADFVDNQLGPDRNEARGLAGLQVVTRRMIGEIGVSQPIYIDNDMGVLRPKIGGTASVRVSF